MADFKTLDEIINKACSFNPEDRYESMGHLLDALTEKQIKIEPLKSAKYDERRYQHTLNILYNNSHRVLSLKELERVVSNKYKLENIPKDEKDNLEAQVTKRAMHDLNIINELVQEHAYKSRSSYSADDIVILKNESAKLQEYSEICKFYSLNSDVFWNPRSVADIWTSQLNSFKLQLNQSADTINSVLADRKKQKPRELKAQSENLFAVIKEYSLWWKVPLVGGLVFGAYCLGPDYLLAIGTGAFTGGVLQPIVRLLSIDPVLNEPVRQYGIKFYLTFGSPGGALGGGIGLGVYNAFSHTPLDTVACLVAGAIGGAIGGAALTEAILRRM